MLSGNEKNTATVTLNASEMNQSSRVALNVPAVAHHEPENGLLLFSRTESKFHPSNVLTSAGRKLPQAFACMQHRTRDASSIICIIVLY